MTRRIAFIFSIATLTVTLAAVGYWMLFSNFATYDDEGYILISARQYLLHGKLYEGVYSQYGPAFYCLMDVLQRGFGPVDHTFARFLTLAFWLGTALCCSGIVWRQTASRSLTFFTLAAVFLYLYFITDEPFHPGSLIFFVLAASLWMATRLIDAGKWAQLAFLTGTSGAILLLTKINAGAFYVVAIAAWTVGHAASDRLRRLAAPLLAVFLGIFAVALMHTLIHEPWIKIYLVLFGCGLLGLLAAIRGEGLVTRKFPTRFLTTGVITGVVILLLIWLRGTSLTGLIDGVLLGPLRHPGNYSYPVDWRPGSLLVAGLSLALTCALPWLERRFSREFTDRVIVMLRLLISLGLLVGVAVLINLRAVGAIFSFVAPLIWILIVPLSHSPLSAGHRASRALVAMVLLLQFLHAYPVGGAQESWGTFLFIPLVAMGLGDVRTWLSLPSRPVLLQRFGWGTIGTVLVAVSLIKTGSTTQRAQRDYHARSELNLPGAGKLRLPPQTATTYRILALNAVVHTDMLFSLPGMFSFNLWTGLPTPTDKNTTLWFSLLNESEQTEIIHRLEADPRAGIIVQDSLVELMRANQIPMKGTLWNYVHQHFAVAFKTDGFAFWTKKDRVITPVNLATVRPQAGRNIAESKYDAQLDFAVIHEGAAVAWIDVIGGSTEAGKTFRLDEKNTRVSVVRATSDGREGVTPDEVAWPVRTNGFVHFTVLFDRKTLTFFPSDTLLVLRGAHGENLGEIRMAE